MLGNWDHSVERRVRFETCHMQATYRVSTIKTNNGLQPRHLNILLPLRKDILVSISI